MIKIIFNTKTYPKKDYDRDLLSKKLFYLSKKPSYVFDKLESPDAKSFYAMENDFFLSELHCISGKIYDMEKEEIKFNLHSSNEKDLLETFVKNVINKYPEYNILWISYGGLQEASYILRKCAAYDLRVTEGTGFTNLIRFKQYPHYDCHAVITGWSFENDITFKEACDSMGIENTLDNKNAEYYSKMAFIGNYIGALKEGSAECEKNVNFLQKLYNKLIRTST